MTPSHWLIPLYYVTEKEVPDDFQDELDKAPMEPFYCHCHQCRSDYHIGNPLKDEDLGKSWDEINLSHEDVLESLQEHETGNRRF